MVTPKRSTANPLPFFEKLLQRTQKTDSLLCIGLDPDPSRLPAKYRTDDLPVWEQLLAWNREIISQTAQYACTYKPNIAFYEALGTDGYTLLWATLQAIPDEVPVLLDAKRSDIGNTAAAYAKACFDELGVDAVTLNGYLGRDSIEPFTAYADKGLFVLCHTSNPGSADFQELEISDWRRLDREQNQPLYMHVARVAMTWSSSIGLVVGATYPESISAIRALSPEVWMLIPGIGAQGGEVEAAVSAGLREDGAGLIINVSRGISLAEEPARAAEGYRDAINNARRKVLSASSSIRKTHSSVSKSESNELFERLVNLEAIKFGEFTLASGIKSPIYIDLRLLVSDPPLLSDVAQYYTEMLRNLQVDRIAGVPYAALPIGTAVSLASDVPMIYPRKEVKEYGLKRGIEGAWETGDHIAIIEDLITSGGSTIETAEKLRSAGLTVQHAIVLIDREQGGVENLARAGITVHSVFKLTEIIRSLLEQDLITAERVDEVTRFIENNRA